MAGDLKWLVTAEAAGSLSTVLEQMGLEIHSIAEGRVFVNGARAESSAIGVREGAIIELRASHGNLLQCSILECRGELVAVAKPSGIPTEPDQHESQASLTAQLAVQLGVERKSLHAVSRLDREVSGVVLVAKSRVARQHLEKLRQSGKYAKEYAGICSLAPECVEGCWSTPVPGRGPRDKLRPARTKFRQIASADPCRGVGRGAMTIVPTLVEMVALTGRFHQLRRHAASANCPFLGDGRYSGARQLARASGSVIAVPRTMLHAVRVRLSDLSGNPWTVRCPLPADMVDIWIKLGGTSPVLDEVAKGDPFGGSQGQDIGDR